MKFNKLIFMIIIFLSSSFYDENIEDEKKYYFGGWPYNNKKDIINGSPLEFNCPNDIGCQCNSNEDCINNNCIKLPRGSYCMPNKGDYFPDFEGLDQFNEFVNIYKLDKKIYGKAQLMVDNVFKKGNNYFYKFKIRKLTIS